MLELGDGIMTQVGLVKADSEGLFGVSWEAKLVPWVPDAAKHLQVRLMVCTHMNAREYRGQTLTLHPLRPHCVWSSMKKNMVGFSCQYLLRGQQSGGVEAAPTGGGGE